MCCSEKYINFPRFLKIILNIFYTQYKFTSFNGYHCITWSSEINKQTKKKMLWFIQLITNGRKCCYGSLCALWCLVTITSTSSITSHCFMLCLIFLSNKNNHTKGQEGKVMCTQFLGFWPWKSRHTVIFPLTLPTLFY